MTYSELIINHKQELEKRLNIGEHLTHSQIFKPVVWDNDNRVLLDWLKKEKLATASHIAKARHRSEVAVMIGAYPENAVEFVEILVKRLDIRVTFQGSMTRLDLDSGGRVDIIVTDFARDARLAASQFRVDIGREEINDAVDRWYSNSRLDRVKALRAMLAPRASFDWNLVARNCFACGADGEDEDFVAAVLKKFIHQVVLKLHGHTVDYHLMTVWTGKQEIGKTYFTKMLVGPLLELMRGTNFSQLADDRNIDLWSSYILFVDEMAHATRADVELIKNVITADTLDRRPMRTNAIVQVRQSATLVGASNKDLSELIRDETGNRRFVAIEYSPPADRDFLKSLDWTAAWQSIKATDADPIDGYRDKLKKLQEEARHLSPVDEWLRQLTREGARGQLAVEKMRPHDLYADYLAHRSDVTGDRDPTPRTEQAWAKELARLVRQFPENSPILSKRSEAGTVWNWNKSAGLRGIDGGQV